MAERILWETLPNDHLSGETDEELTTAPHETRRTSGGVGSSWVRWTTSKRPMEVHRLLPHR